MIADVVIAAYDILAGHFQAAGHAAAMAGVAAGFALFFVGLTAFGRWLSRDEVIYLRSWLAERLQTQA